jgi:hypothetical protein
MPPNNTERCGTTGLKDYEGDDTIEQEQEEGLGRHLHSRRDRFGYFHAVVRHFSINEGSPLLGGGGTDKRPPLWDHPWWRATHAFGFLLGGITFWIGTLLYYPAIYAASVNNDDAVMTLGVLTAWLYIIGSTGFLYVDVQEFLTFTNGDVVMLRINIACSLLGSLLYVIGSAGFLPHMYEYSPLVGIGGFWGGSLAIGSSQAWKLTRILSTTTPRLADDPDDDNILTAEHRTNAACVEGGAMVGGYCFLIGTTLFWRGPIAGDDDCMISCGNYDIVLALWMVGSVAFTFGGWSLARRHYVYKIT